MKRNNQNKNVIPGDIVRTFISSHGKPVTFRYIKREDVDAVLQYINTLIAEDTFIGLCGKPLTRSEEEKFIDESVKNLEAGDKSHIIVEIDGHVIGEAEVRRDRLPRKKHVGSMGISFLAQYRKEGIGTKLLQTLFDEARRMELRIIELTCLENNSVALHVYEKMGFLRVGIIPGAIMYKGKFIDEVILYKSLVTE